MKLKSILTAPVLALTLVAANAGATDWYGMVNQQAAEQAAYVQGIVQQNMANPQIQAQYQQALANGYQGSIEQFAYGWAATGGYSDGGKANYAATSRQIATQQQNAMNGYHAAVENSRNAMNGLNDGFSRNMQEAGNGLMGNGTYSSPYPNSNQVLPYGWQQNTVNQYNNQHYWVDHAGNYYHIDPNNSGWMAPVYPTYGR